MAELRLDSLQLTCALSTIAHRSLMFSLIASAPFLFTQFTCIDTYKSRIHDFRQKINVHKFNHESAQARID